MQLSTIIRHASWSVGLALVCSPHAASAQNFTTTPVGVVTVDASIGALQGRGKEFVFDPNAGGRTVSKLVWEMEAVGMANAALQYRPWSWLMVGARGSINLSHSGQLDDFDYNIGICPPTPNGGDLCHSNSPNTRTQDVQMLDAFLAGRFLNAGGLNFSAVAGYKIDHYKWQAYGGTANYGILPPGLGITYDQWWQAPYLGLAVDGQWGKVGMSARVYGSPWSDGNDRDHHHLRSLIFREPDVGGGFAGADLGFNYQVSENVRVTADYRYQRWFLGKGPTRVEDLFGGGVGVFPGDSGGASNESHALSLGLKVNLQAAAHAEHGSIKDAPAYSPVGWAGLYAGVAAGVLFQDNNWTTTQVVNGAFPVFAPTANESFEAVAPVVTGYAGYNWQHGPWVYGVEFDVGKSTASRTTIGIPGTAPQFLLGLSADSVVVESTWEASLRARSGYLVHPNMLVYATGGVAGQYVSARASCQAFLPVWCLGFDNYDPVSKFRVGYTVGAGAELMLAHNWMLRGEYRYTDLGAATYRFFNNSPIDAVAAEIDSSSHRLTVGLGYKF